MYRHVMALANQFLIHPAAALIDLTTLAICRPRAAARLLGKAEGLKRALLYFGAAVSAAVILTKVGFSALGIEEIAEIPYWLLHATLVACIALLSFALSSPFKLAPPVMLPSVALLAYGAGFLLTGVIVAGAGLTLAALQWVGYIPQFGSDTSSLAGWDAVGMRFYWDCLRRDHLFARVIYHGLGGAFETLSDPIHNLAHVHRVFYVAASLLFATLAFFGATRCRVVSGLAALLGSALVIFAVVAVVGTYRGHLHRTTTCLQESVDATGERTAEDQVRLLAELAAKDIGAPIAGSPDLTLLNVEARGRSLILRVRAKAPTTDPIGLRLHASIMRQHAVNRLCNDLPMLKLFRTLKISRVWLLHYHGTDVNETIVVGADQCVR